MEDQNNQEQVEGDSKDSGIVMKVGYARVSTKDQRLDLQIDALKKHGCTKIFSENKSGKNMERSEFQKCIEFLRSGDTLMVWRLDRLARSLKDLIEVMNRLKDENKNFYSIQENIDTTTAVGKLVFHIFGSLAQFERELTSERIKAGMEAARKRGKGCGKKRKIGKRKLSAAWKLYKQDMRPGDIADALGVSLPTLYRALNLHGRYDNFYVQEVKLDKGEK